MTFWGLFRRYARRERAGLFLSTALVLLRVVPDVLQPWPVKALVDSAIMHHPLPAGFKWMPQLPGAGTFVGLSAWLSGAALLLFLASALARMAQRYVQAGTGARMSYALSADVFERVQRLSIGYHGRRATGDLVRRLTVDILCLRDLLVSVLLVILDSVAALALMFVLMWQLDRLLAVLVVVVALPLGLVLKLFAGRMIERDFRQQQMEGQVMAYAEQSLGALPLIQAFNREQHEERRFRSLSVSAIAVAVRATALHATLGLATGGMLGIGTALIFIVGGLAVLHGQLTLGGLIVFITYLYSFQSPLEQLAPVTSTATTAAGSARRVIQVLEEEPDVRDAPHAQAPVGRAAGEVRLEGVTFGYEPGRPVLEGVSVGADPGEAVALVGHTGAGKSTLVSLIPRFFDPWSGRVTVDRHDVRDLTLASVRAQISVVLQEPFLLPLSVAENIAYGRPGASPREVVAAAVAAQADEFIRALPDGYETVIDERGASLSGGERQRLAIARALLKDAPILILDEPTSALDSETEASLLQALERLIEGRTTFVIAHRLSTVRRCNRIVVLDHGRIAEIGSHNELANAGGIYQRVHLLQMGFDTNHPLDDTNHPPAERKQSPATFPRQRASGWRMRWIWRRVGRERRPTT
jgi:ATP-binding cassette subfamily B protein/subfamily B ATP-binding cassette protein MsbA